MDIKSRQAALYLGYDMATLWRWYLSYFYEIGLREVDDVNYLKVSLIRPKNVTDTNIVADIA